MEKTFCNAVEETLGVIVTRAGFKLTPALISEGDYCVFIKRYNEQIALYIKCTDHRSKGGDIVIALWIAPIEFPDDRIEVLNIGFKVVVYSDYEVSDEIMHAVGQKIVELSNNISSLAVAVEKDLTNPFIENQRTKFYFLSREMYNKLTSANEYTESFEELRSATRKCIEDKLSFDTMKDQCTSFIGTVRADVFSGPLTSLKPQEKGRMLACTLYAESLLEG